MTALLTVEEAARELRISTSTIHHLTAQRRIGFLRLGRRIYLSPADIDTYIASRRVEPEAAGA